MIHVRWPRRQERRPESARRANPTAIAVLEHDLFGIQPEPGTAAAMTIALRKAAADCFEHAPVETTTLGSPGSIGLCTRCGCDMIQDAGGEWVRT